MPDMRYDGQALLDLLTDAKLAGQLNPGPRGGTHRYMFRSNEQAAEVAWRVVDPFFTPLLERGHCPGCTCGAEQ